MEELIGIKKAAHMLGVDPETLRNWDNNGQLKAIRTKGGHRRYKLSDIQKLQNDKQSD